MRVSGENSRQHKTLAEEDMLNHVTKLASAVHGASVVPRFFQRFQLFLSLIGTTFGKKVPIVAAEFPHCTSRTGMS